MHTLEILHFLSSRDIGQLSPHFGAISLLKYTENLEKQKKKSTGENSKDIHQWRRRPCTGDSAPYLHRRAAFQTIEVGKGKTAERTDLQNDERELKYLELNCQRNGEQSIHVDSKVKYLELNCQRNGEQNIHVDSKVWQCYLIEFSSLHVFYASLHSLMSGVLPLLSLRGHLIGDLANLNDFQTHPKPCTSRREEVLP